LKKPLSEGKLTLTTACWSDGPKNKAHAVALAATSDQRLKVRNSGALSVGIWVR
jgi:hypothetical protein